MKFGFILGLIATILMGKLVYSFDITFIEKLLIAAPCAAILGIIAKKVDNDD